ncbi:hypothetical protein SUGI_0107700 [Cryptomeria japonica]|uniref:calmodulin-like protein 7 n=1 Tax=Cryptomeria japonica TaxID=3369 RepID=UPI002408B4A0|nr:calmodulin-like protein 7 [Cryptomeria japonica]GLJ09376.1 hypothetical protein SUGI_0107700 [Cryptomeria japonica]
MGSLRASYSLLHGAIQRLRSWIGFLVWFMHHPKLHSLLKFHCNKVLESSNYNAHKGEDQIVEEKVISFESEVRPALVLPKEYLQRVFSMFDRDVDGLISSEDIRCILENLGLIVSSEHLDITPDFLGFDEFLGLYNSLWDVYYRGDLEDEDVDELMEVFNVFDKDGDGYICASELQQILHSLGLKEGRDISVCESMIRKVDINSDGKVDFNEFKHMMLLT